MKISKSHSEINWPLHLQGQKTKIRESKERKIKARATKTISLVLLRKGPESIAHWRKRTGRRRFLDCLIKTNWTSTPICSIALISSYALCYIFRSISLSKPSLKIGSVNKAFLFWYWQQLKKKFFRNKTFLFFKKESWNFQHLLKKNLVKPHEISTQSDNQ